MVRRLGLGQRHHRPYLAGIDLGSGEVTDVDAHLGEHHWAIRRRC
jgi:hypothetical protein